jgi:hypothetical protein
MRERSLTPAWTSAFRIYRLRNRSRRDNRLQIVDNIEFFTKNQVLRPILLTYILTISCKSKSLTIYSLTYAGVQFAHGMWRRSKHV